MTYIANGVGWYFNNISLFSWGFVRAGDSVVKDNCDVDTTGANDERLCWHLQSAGGYRCGATQGLNESNEFERLVFTASPTAIPTMTDWGMIIMVGVLGTIGMLTIWLRSSRASSKKT